MNDELLSAIKAGEEARVALLLDNDASLLKARTPEGVSAISLALYYGRPAIAQLFLARGAALDIFEASAVGQLDRVMDLVAADPSLVHAYSPDGFQPLGLACYFGHEDIVRFLVQAGADVEAPSKNAMMVRAIHAAAARRASGIIRFLLEHGADPDAQQQQGFVALHSAAQSGDEATVAVLLDAGANTSAATASGKTPADLAQEAGHVALAARLGGRT
jgi:ankyrin repeat protein